MTDADINRVLLKAADAAVAATDSILAANAADLARMSKEDPKYDRLMLTADRIASIANDMRSVAALPSPLGVTLREWTQPNGMKIRKVSVPFGVIGIIYEARPNVTFDVFSLCLKSGSACVLKGGSDADSSNRTIVEVLRGVLLSEGIDEACVTLLPPDHATTQEMLGAVGYVDLVIPRGSSRLINFVRDNARIPVIETGAGVCHCYIHSSADILKAQAIVTNAKTRRVSVCNALDSLVIDESRLADLPIIVEKMAAKKVEIRADYTPGGLTSYSVHAPGLHEVYEEYEDALASARENAKRLAADEARRRGAMGELNIRLDVDAHVFQAAYGVEVDLGTSVVAMATGRMGV